jgi:hypothetical protein
MPDAVCTAKGNFIYIVTFPEADGPMEQWPVQEFKIELGGITADRVKEAKGGTTPQNEAGKLDWATNSQRGVAMAKDVVGKLKTVKMEVYKKFLENARKNRSGTGPYADGTVAVVGDFLEGRENLGRVITFEPPGVAQESFLGTLDTEDVVSLKDQHGIGPGDTFDSTKSMPTLKAIIDDRPEEFDVDIKKLHSRLVEHVQMEFLKDMFENDGGLKSSVGLDDVDVNGLESSSDVNDTQRDRMSSVGDDAGDIHFDFSDEGLDSKDKIVFSNSWKFDNEFETFNTNWVSGWYLTTLRTTGHRFDAETALIFDFGSGEGKALLCSYVNGQVSSTELLKYEQMLKYVMNRDGHSPDELKASILRQAQEVNAGLLVIGTTSWHRTCGVEEQKSVDKFFGTLVNDLKNTKLRFIYHPVDLTTNDDKKEGFGDGKKDEGGRPRTTSLVEKVAELGQRVDKIADICLSNFQEAEEKGKFVPARNPMLSVTTPLDPTDEGGFEATAVGYAAGACGVPDMGAIMGAGNGSTQISAVQGDVVATCFNELGAKKGVDIFKKVAKTRAALQEAVDNKWGKMIRDQVAEWTMTSGNPDIDGKKATDFLKEHTTNKSVVGISAVFYAMSGTKPIKDAAEAAELPRIPQPKLLDSLKKKLKDILTLSGPNGTGDFEYVEESV